MLAKSQKSKPSRARTRANKNVAALEIAPPTDPAPEHQFARLLDSKFSAERKTFPVTTGFLDYFPDAVAAGAEVSFLGNQKHNPGEPLHHARGKSSDHADCIGRHLIQRGGFEEVEIAGVNYLVRHSAALFWRAAALLQEELEYENRKLRAAENVLRAMIAWD